MLSTSFSNKTQYLIRDTLHCSLCRIVETRKCSRRRRRRRRRRRGRAGYPARRRCLAGGRNDGGRW